MRLYIEAHGIDTKPLGRALLSMAGLIAQRIGPIATEFIAKGSRELD